MQCNAMQCNAMQLSNAMQCNAMQLSNAMQCNCECNAIDNAMQLSNAMQCNCECNAMQCGVLLHQLARCLKLDSLFSRVSQLLVVLLVRTGAAARVVPTLVQERVLHGLPTQRVVLVVGG